jgi:hypothetical protein
MNPVAKGLKNLHVNPAFLKVRQFLPVIRLFCPGRSIGPAGIRLIRP